MSTEDILFYHSRLALTLAKSYLQPHLEWEQVGFLTRETHLQRAAKTIQILVREKLITLP